MDHYRKGKNVEETLTRNTIPIANLPENFIWMQVHGGTKIYNVLQYALAKFPSVGSIVWTGSGPAVKKAISCVEIMKRELGYSLHQINKICYRTYEEFWEPLIEDLDQIVVKRRVPMIHILLSVNPLNENELGYQSPGMKIPFKKEIIGKEQKSERNELRKDLDFLVASTSNKDDKRSNENKNKTKSKFNKQKKKTNYNKLE